jgi:hypothetical protein
MSDGRRIAVKAPRVPELDERKWDPKPATQGELDAYFDRGGVVTLRHPHGARRNRLEARRAKRLDERAGITKQQRDWIRNFEPRAVVVPEAVLIVRRHLELLKPTARKNAVKWSRIKSAVRAIGLEGVTQAKFAA